MLESVMSISLKIKGLKPSMSITDFMNRYNIESDDLDLSQIQVTMCLSHVAHLYEIVERTQILKLLEYLRLVKNLEQEKKEKQIKKL